MDLTLELALKIGYTFGKIIGQNNYIAMAGDTRISTPKIKEKLIEGLSRTGNNVIDLGVGPTPMIYFTAAANRDITEAIMVTGSHNPSNQNGIKICNRNGVSYHYQSLYKKIEKQIKELNTKKILDLESSGKIINGSDYKSNYFEFLKDELDISHPLKILVDFGNGATFDFKKSLNQEGLDVVYMGTKDQKENNDRQPDPAKPGTYNNLKEYMDSSFDFALVFDTDGDRVGFMTNSNEIISPDQIAMIFAEEIKEKYDTPKIIMDVKISKATSEYVEKLGGVPILSQVGHSYIHELLFEEKAHFAAELSGHYYFYDNYYGFDDGLYTTVRIMNIVSKLLERKSNLNEKLQNLPYYYPTPEYRIPMSNQQIKAILDDLTHYANKNLGEINRIDGIRVEFNNSWFLARKSGTESVLTYRIEGNTPEIRDRLLEDIQRIINRV